METKKQPRSESRLSVNFEAERATLGAMMTSVGAREWILANVQAVEYANGDHLRLFGVISSLYARGESVNLVTVMAEWDRQVGKTTLSIADFFKDEFFGDYRSHVRVLKDCVRRRRIQTTLTKALEEISSTEDVGSLVAKVTAQINESEVEFQKQLAPIEKVALMASKRIENAAEGKSGSLGLPTGMKRFDDEIGGVRPGEVFIIGGRPSLGKSAMATTIARNSGALGFGSIIINAEMQLVDIGIRLYAREVGLANFDLRNGRVDADDIRAIGAAYTTLAKLPIVFFDDANWDRAKLQIRIAKRERPDLGWLMIDYIQLLRMERLEGEKRYEQLGRLMREIKAIAVECQLATIVLAQIGRSKDNQEPGLQDLRESGDLEQDADIVGFLHRYKEKERENVVWLIKKNRNGPTGAVRVRFIENLVSYHDWDD